MVAARWRARLCEMPGVRSDTAGSVGDAWPTAPDGAPAARRKAISHCRRGRLVTRARDPGTQANIRPFGWSYRRRVLMRVPSFGLLLPAVVAGMLAAPPLVMSQAVALPLRGEGEFALADKQYDVRAGSVLLKGDSTVKIFFIDGTLLRTAVVGAWRSRNASTIEFAVLD